MFVDCERCGRREDHHFNFQLHDQKGLELCWQCYQDSIVSPRYPSLTQAQIIEAFPAEIRQICPLLITEARKGLRAYDERIKAVKLRHYDAFDEKLYIGIIDKPEAEKAQIARLEGLLHALDAPQQSDTRVTEAQIAQARAVPIENLYAFEKLRRSGPNRLQACCPFHGDKKPSLVIYQNKNAPQGEHGGCHCFSCGANCADSIAFIMKLRGLTFPQAVRALTLT